MITQRDAQARRDEIEQKEAGCDPIRAPVNDEVDRSPDNRQKADSEEKDSINPIDPMKRNVKCHIDGGWFGAGKIGFPARSAHEVRLRRKPTPKFQNDQPQLSLLFNINLDKFRITPFSLTAFSPKSPLSAQ